MDKIRPSPETLGRILQDAETLLIDSRGQADLVSIKLSIRRMIRIVNPSRRKVRSSDGLGKTCLSSASPAELLAALRFDVESAIKLDPASGFTLPYKSTEKLFREPCEELPAHASVATVADAIAAGAVDFNAAESNDRVFCILPPGSAHALASGLAPLPCFVPRGGIFGLVGFEGFYIMPAALSDAQVS